MKSIKSILRDRLLFKYAKYLSINIMWTIFAIAFTKFSYDFYKQNNSALSTGFMIVAFICVLISKLNEIICILDDK